MDTIDLFKKAAAALQTDPCYLALAAAREANDKDEALQDMIGEFNLCLLYTSSAWAFCRAWAWIT